MNEQMTSNLTFASRNFIDAEEEQKHKELGVRDEVNLQTAKVLTLCHIFLGLFVFLLLFELLLPVQRPTQILRDNGEESPVMGKGRDL
jgi:hypothetical protein